MAIETITVLGAGTMGCGIAHVSALGGCRTLLHAMSPDVLHRARGAVSADLKGKVPPAEAEAALARLVVEPDLARAAGGADFLIEAVPEEIALEIDLFRRVNACAASRVVFASSTSALSIREMGTVVTPGESGFRSPDDP